MKKSIFFFCLFLITSIGFSQSTKIILGGGISKIQNSAKMPIFDESVFVFSAGVGIDVLEREKFYLSNEIGYFQLGGKDDLSNLQPPYNDLTSSYKMNYIYASSSFRYKFPLEEKFFFIGLGPKLSLNMDSDPFKNTIYEDGYKIEKLLFGINGEIGYMHEWNDYRIGIVGSYLLNINRMGYSIANDLKSNPIYFSLSFGYDFL